MNQHDPQVYDN